MSFELQATEGRARAGVFTTAHGRVHTPIFMPVGTAGTVKALHQKELREDINADIILGNTYHLFLRPGTDILKEAGGLHKFMGWDRAILTDSGGFQVYSLSKIRKINEEGVDFRSHIDGTPLRFTPEYVMQVQREIGADIVMAFDECPPWPSTYEYAEKSMHLTHRWLDRCIRWLEENPELYGFRQALFPIVQGSTFPELRKQSAEYIAAAGCPGNAIGGLAVGEPAEAMYDTIELVNCILPQDKPRYLMGVGTPANILESIFRGVDMFDCVMPTRNARNGMLFTDRGIVNIRNKRWERAFEPLNSQPLSFVDTDYTLAYLRHLFIGNERLGAQIASINNLAFYLWLVRQARQHILDGTFTKWKNDILETVSRRL